MEQSRGICPAKLACFLKKREGVPEMGTKPLKALRGHLIEALIEALGALIEALKGPDKHLRL